MPSLQWSLSSSLVCGALEDDGVSEGENEQLPSANANERGLLGAGFEVVAMLEKTKDVVENTVEKKLNKPTND